MKKKKNNLGSTLLVVVLLNLLGFSNNVFATQQIPETLIYEDQGFDLSCYPMDEFFEKNPKQKPKATTVCSALWRGYIGTYKIIDNYLCLVNLHTWKTRQSRMFGKKKWLRNSDLATYKFKTTFPGVKKVNISWLTSIEILQINPTKQKEYKYGSIQKYEKYVFLDIIKGEVKRKAILSTKEYDSYRAKLFVLFKKTDQYNKEIEKRIQFYKRIATKPLAEDKYYQISIKMENQEQRIKDSILRYYKKFPADIDSYD